jgi:uncharacterized protein YndB with AHSA1/START domain
LQIPILTAHFRIFINKNIITMEQVSKPIITIQATVEAGIEKVWHIWNTPGHVTNWNFAAPEWHCPTANNDLRVGGMFNYRMEARDGSFGFDFYGTYDEVVPKQKIGYTLGDGRKVEVFFEDKGDKTEVIETFEAEQENPVDMQRTGWQAILNNFKKYVETATF